MASVEEIKCFRAIRYLSRLYSGEVLTQHFVEDSFLYKTMYYNRLEIKRIKSYTHVSKSCFVCR
jgi:hypothetical protein